MKNNFNTFFILFIILFQSILTKDASFLDKRKYPNRKSIKGLQPDGQDTGQIIGNEVHTVAYNIVWLYWQPTLKKGTCSSDEYSYNGFCYTLNRDTIDKIKIYTNADVMVTAVVYGVPDWARRPCSYGPSPMFCAPTDEGATFYGYFLKFLAFYFNGENGNGRISDFVIYNEVSLIPKYFNTGQFLILFIILSKITIEILFSLRFNIFREVNIILHLLLKIGKVFSFKLKPSKFSIFRVE